MPQDQVDQAKSVIFVVEMLSFLGVLSYVDESGHGLNPLSLVISDDGPALPLYHVALSLILVGNALALNLEMSYSPRLGRGYSSTVSSGVRGRDQALDIETRQIHTSV